MPWRKASVGQSVSEYVTRFSLPYTNEALIEDFFIDCLLLVSEFSEGIEDDTKNDLNEEQVDEDKEAEIVEVSAPVMILIHLVGGINIALEIAE